MIYKNYKGTILGDFVSVWVATIFDKNDPNKVFCYKLIGTLPTGKNITLAKFNTEDEAKAALDKVTPKECQTIS